MANVSPRGKVLMAYKMREVDPTLSYSAIGRALGIKNQTVRTWLQPDTICYPYYDWVVVARAVKGNGAAYDALTPYEHGLVVGLLERARFAGEPVLDRFPVSHRDKVNLAIERRKNRVEGRGRGARRAA